MHPQNTKMEQFKKQKKIKNDMGKKYLVILADRKRANMAVIENGVVVEYRRLPDDKAPRKTKNGENTWDAEDKILRHRDELLNRHLENIGDEANKFAVGKKINGVVIGGHKELFHKISENLRYPLSKKFIGFFITELKVHKNESTKKALKCIEKIEQEQEEQKLQVALT